MKISKTFLLFLFLITAQLLPAKVLQYENRVIRSVEMTLAKPKPGEKFNSNVQISRMTSRQGTLFSETAFDTDLKLLASEFDRVDPKVRVVDEEVVITLKVWPKPTVRSITWEGNERVTTKKLQSELGIALQGTFDRKQFNEKFRELQKYYTKKGFFEAKLRYETNTDHEANEVDILIIIDEGRSGRIGKITVRGVEKEEATEIENLLYSKKYSIPWSWFTEQGTYREDFVQQDKLMVLDYLHNHGYAEASVDLTVEESDSKERVELIFTVEKGPLYRTGTLTFSGYTLFDFETIDRQFAIREGDLFSPEKIRDTVQNITDLYGKHGYIDAIVSYEPHLDRATHTYSVDFTISEGEQYRVGMIKVFGNGWTSTNVILHETLVIPGEVFDLTKLKMTEVRLMNIGYFENVNVYAVHSDELSQLGDNFRDVHIEVEEKGTGSFGFSGGISSKTKMFAGLNLTERNFDILGVPRIFKDGLTAMRGGGQYAHFQLSLAQKETSIVASWTKPYFRDTDWTIGFDVEKISSAVNSDTYTIKQLGFGLHASKPINAFVRFGTSYNLSDNQIDVVGDAPAEVVKAAKNSGIISSITLSLTYDSRDRPLEPTQGFFSRLKGTYAGLGGKFNFFELGYLNSYYAPMSVNGTMKIRADIQQLVPVFGTGAEELPQGTRYFLGGDDTVRGYRYGAIGDTYAGTDVQKGGVTSLLFSTEYMHRFTDMISGFVFVDGGSISNKTFNVKNFTASVGYGARLKVVPNLPPVIVGMGHPINPRDRSDVMKFFLTVGGSF